MHKVETIHFTDILNEDIKIKWENISDRSKLDLIHVQEPQMHHRSDVCWPVVYSARDNERMCALSLESDDNGNPYISMNWCGERIPNEIDASKVKNKALESLKDEGSQCDEMRKQAFKLQQDGKAAIKGDVARVKEILQRHGIDSAQKFTDTKSFRYGYNVPKLDGLEPIACISGKDDADAKFYAERRADSFRKMGFSAKLSDAHAGYENKPMRCIFITSLP